MKAYIDYSGESNDEEADQWTKRGFKRYFLDTYYKVHHAGGAVPWGVKEDALLSRMYGDYAPADFVDMILHWHLNTSKPGVACQFANFYSCRVDTYHRMKKATSDYSWD